jgi:hypothetical protein
LSISVLSEILRGHGSSASQNARQATSVVRHLLDFELFDPIGAPVTPFSIAT